MEKTHALIAGEIPAYVTEQRFVKRDGSIVWVRNNVFPVHDKDGLPINIVRLTQDITQQRLAEASLRKIEAWNESILAGISDIHVVLDRQWRYVYLNSAAVEAIGRPRTDSGILFAP